MTLKAYRSTTIEFGMVPVPVKLYKLTSDKALSKDIHQVHGGMREVIGDQGEVTVTDQRCGSRIQMPKWCPECQRHLEAHELQKAYFMDKSNNVVLTDEDYDRLPLSNLKSIAIEGFIPPITDWRRFNGGLYGLSPTEVGQKAFVLFTRTMEALDVWGIAKMSTREKESLVAIFPSYDGLLMLQSLHWGHELRGYEELVPVADVSEKELQMGMTLIQSMNKVIDLDSYTDDYTTALRDLVVAKLEGTELPPPVEAKPVPGMSLEDQLLGAIAAAANA